MKNTKLSRHEIQTWKGWCSRFRAAVESYKATTRKTDADIAEEIGVSRASLSHWKLNRRTPELANFMRACEVLRTDPRLILFGETEVADCLLGSRINSLSTSHRAMIMLAIEGAESVEASIKRHPEER